MFNFIKKLFSSAALMRPQAGDSPLPNNRTHHQSVPHDGSDTASRSRLVHTVMRDLIRKSSIPAGWIQCQIQVVSSRTRGQGIFVRLVVKQWDERLMKYAFAFQKALLTDIVQFEPKAAAWLHGIAWQLEVADTCPITDLPDGQFWNTHEVTDPFDIVAMPASAMPAHAHVAGPMAAPRYVAAVAPFIPATPVIAAAAAPGFSLTALKPQPPVLDKPPTSENDTEEDLQRLFAIRDRELKQMAVSQLSTPGYEKTEPTPL